MFASTIFDDAGELQDFLCNVEALLRRGQPDVAANILEGQLDELASEGQQLARVCLRTPVNAIRILGWEEIESHLSRLDRPEKPVTAISFDISAPLTLPEADDESPVEPLIETIFYCDSAFAFSKAGRDDIIAAYDHSGSRWRGKFLDVGKFVTVRGLGVLYASLLHLERSVREGETDDPLDHDAYALVSAFIAVRLHQTFRAVLEGRGLPRAIAVLVGSDEAYPRFDAPVMARDEYEDLLDSHYEEDGDDYTEMYAPLVLAPMPDDYDPFANIEDDGQVSGASLRKRLREQACEDQTEEAGSRMGLFLGRLMRRNQVRETA